MGVHVDILPSTLSKGSALFDCARIRKKESKA
jgi:hypothetical protein